MTLHRTLLVAAAVFALVALIRLTTTGDRDRASSARSAQTTTTTATTGRHAPAPVAQSPAVRVAVRYALTARNWSAPTYTRAWRGELALAAGGYRRRLRAASPTRRALSQLTADGASSVAVLLAARQEPRVHGPRARVVVTLHERTLAAGQLLDGPTRNLVTLRHTGGRWRVTGFTVIPGAGA